jgi:AcrR family transcriptional regulator
MTSGTCYSYERMIQSAATSDALRESPSARGEATRADLIAAARRLFGRRGFDGTSIRAITREAGANLGAVTYHFGSKRGLYGAVLEQGLRPIAERVRAAAASPGSALERMLRVVEAYFEHFEANPDLPHLLLQEVAAGKQPPTVVLDIVRGVKETIARLQIEGAAEGSVRPGHPVLTALSVVSQPIYLALVAPLLRTVGPLDLSEPATRHLALEHTLAFVRAGLEPSGHEETSP